MTYTPQLALPKFLHIRQLFPHRSIADIDAEITKELAALQPLIRPGMKIAVGVGSRGISNIKTIVQSTIGQLRLLGAEPFIVPAMGSHGGATSEGQLEVLASYGITPESMGVAINASMETVILGHTAEGVPGHCSAAALEADGIFLINRIKPHTDFFGTLGSGLIKMCVIGLGKRRGAETMHLAATQFGYEHMIRSMANVIIDNSKLIGGLAIIEDQYHDTAKLQFVERNDFTRAESMLLEEARAMMPLLPFREIDLLIVDRIGKNISGAGMDPNVINRSIHGYNSLPIRTDDQNPFIRRIYVRGLTEETHGNAIGIGMADITSKRLVHEADLNKTFINSLTALTPQSAKLPIAVESDLEAIELMLKSLPIKSYDQARIVRIADTLSVAEMKVSQPLWEEIQHRVDIERVTEPYEFQFNSMNNFID